MEDKLRGAIQESLMEIAVTMLFLDVETTETGMDDIETTAVVGLSGAINGGLHLVMPLGGACLLAGSLTGMDTESLDDEAQDALGELANMIAGGIQTRLSSEMGNISLTPPLVAKGNPRTPASPGLIRQGFVSQAQSFAVEVHYQP